MPAISRAALGLACALALAAPAAAKPGLVGDYRVAEGPDVGGGLRIAADGRFAYFLAAGALDEQAQGTWRAEGDKVCLTTAPKPVPPEFRKAALQPVDGAVPTVRVTWPNGQGVAGVDFVIGFDAGEPLRDYTQEHGWTLPEGETRAPRWIELTEPIHRFASPRYELGPADNGALHVVMVPNDLGTVDFENACFERSGKAFVLHRREGDMRFVREGR